MNANCDTLLKHSSKTKYPGFAIHFASIYLLSFNRSEICIHSHIQMWISNCANAGPNNTWPPISTVVPTLQLSLPSNISCGQVSNGATNGSYRSPGFPEYRHNLHCAYVIKVPKGYYVNITLRNFAVQQRYVCMRSDTLTSNSHSSYIFSNINPWTYPSRSWSLTLLSLKLYWQNVHVCISCIRVTHPYKRRGK